VRSGSPSFALVLQQREDVASGKLFAAVEKEQFEHEADASDMAADFFYELADRASGPACGQHVIDNQDVLPALDGVLVNLQAVEAVFELVLDLDALGRQLLGLAHRDETGPERVGQRRAEDESARLNADHGVDLCAAVVIA